MQRHHLMAVGLMSLVAIASSTSITHAGAGIRVMSRQSVPTISLATQAKLPKATPGFIPANLEKSTFPFEGGRNIFDKDDRIPMNSSKYPWSAIGRIEVPIDQKTMEICTGTLISKNLVITNAHCVLDEKNKQITTNKIQFRPNLVNGESKTEAVVTKIISGTTDPQGDRGNDWAVLILDRPLGETYGWIGFAIADLSDLDSLKGEITLAGYSYDFPKETPAVSAGVHQGCSIRGFGPQPGVISHDCDMMAGASGGPMFAFAPDGSAIIIALNAAHRTPAESPTGVHTSRFSRESKPWRLCNNLGRQSRRGAESPTLRKAGLHHWVSFL